MKSVTSGQLVVSIVVPVLNEEASIRPFLERVEFVREQCREAIGRDVDFEYIFVNDGSQDQTLAILCSEQRRNKLIRIVDFSRNFGKESALSAGIDIATGQVVIPIDVDLQDPPELIVPMLQAWQDGNEVVLARRASRAEDTSMKRVTAGLFYKFHNSMSATKIPENVGDFRLMDRIVVDALKTLPESRRFMKGLFAWVGFKTAVIDYARAPRSTGKTKFSAIALWSLAVEGFTSFSTAPLVVWTYVGLSVSLLSFFFALIVVVQKAFWGIDIPGYAALSVAIFFLSGVQLVGIGILGEYLGRVYSEVKRRPVYLVRKIYESDE